MPRLVDYTALGPRETGRTGRPAATSDLAAEKTAFAGIGNSLARVGDVFGSMASKQEAEDNRIATSTATANLLKEQNAFENRMRENPDNWQNHEKEYDDHIAQAKQRSAALITDPRQRKLWEAQNQSTIEGWRQRVSSTVRSRHNDAFLSQTQTDINELRNIALDPNTPEDERGLHIEAAGNMIEDARRRGVINDQQARDWSQRWREGYAVSKLEMMSPAERLQRLQSVSGGGLVPPVDGTFAGGPRSGYGAARGPTRAHAGVDWQAENGTPARSSIEGKVVYVGSHAGYGNTVDVLGSDGNVHRYALHEGGVQVKIGDAVTAGQQIGTVGGRHVHNEIIRNGSEAWKLATSGQFGATSRQGGRAEQTIDPMAVYGLKPGSRVNGSSSQPAGSLGAYREESGGAPLQRATPDPIASLLPPDTRQKMETRAQFEIDRDRRQETAAVQSLVADDLSSIQNTGKPIADLTRDRVAAAYGEEGAAKWEKQRASAQTVYDTTAEFPQLTNDQIAERVEKVRPKGGEEGFKEQQGTHDAIAKAAAKIIKERDEDPAQSVGRLPAVSEALSAMRKSGETPQGWQALGKARLQAQAAIGIPEAARSPITVAEARRIMTPVTEAQEGEQVRALREVANKFDELFGPLAPAAFAAAINSVSVDKETARAAAPILRRLVQGQKVPDQEMAAFQAAMQDQTMYRSVAPLASDYDPFKASPGGGPMFGPASEQEPAAPPQTRIIPPSAIKELRLNPQSAEAFMQKYGKDDYGRGAALKAMEALGIKPQKKPAQ